MVILSDDLVQAIVNTPIVVLKLESVSFPCCRRVPDFRNVRLSPISEMRAVLPSLCCRYELLDKHDRTVHFVSSCFFISLVVCCHSQPSCQIESKICINPRCVSRSQGCAE